MAKLPIYEWKFLTNPYEGEVNSLIYEGWRPWETQHTPVVVREFLNNGESYRERVEHHHYYTLRREIPDGE